MHNAAAQLRADQIKARAEHAQSLNSPTAAAFVSETVLGTGCTPLRFADDSKPAHSVACVDRRVLRSDRHRIHLAPDRWNLDCICTVGICTLEVVHGPRC